MAMQPEDIRRLDEPDHLGLALADNLAQCVDEEHKLEVLTAWLEMHEGTVDRKEALAMDSFLTHGDVRQKFYRVLNRTHPPND